MSGVHPQAVVAPDAVLEAGVTVEACVVVGPQSRIGARARIGAGCYLGVRVRIGADSVLEPGVVVLDDCSIGSGVHIDSGSVIGTDGFGYVEDGGSHHKIPQVGTVDICDRSRLGPGVCIDRATTGTTRVGTDCELETMVQLGHNVQIGDHCRLRSQVGIAGSTVLGDHVTIESQAGLHQHITVGSGAHIGPRAGVINNVPEGAHYTGFPARPQEETAAIDQAVASLPQWFRENFKNLAPGAQES